MQYRINFTGDTIQELGQALGEPIQELEEKILDKEQEIAEKDEIIAEKQAIIDAFPTIESKSITANGTYSEEGKAYSPVTVNVPESDDLIAYTIKLGIESTDKKVLYASGGHQSQMNVSTGNLTIITYVSRKNSQTDSAFVDILTDATSRTTNLINGASATLMADSSINSILPGWKRMRIGLTASVALDKVRANDIGSITLS